MATQKVSPMMAALCGFGVLMLVLIFLVQMKVYFFPNPILRQRLSVKEAFQMAPKVEDSPARLHEGLSPSEAGLERPRQPYTLLNDWLSPKLPEEASTEGNYNPPGAPAEIPDSVYGQTVADIYGETNVKPRPAFTAATCFASDFQGRLELTGNYRQLTNNYKRGDPDSCTAGLHDVAVGYYKTMPLEPAGCIDRKSWERETLVSTL